MAPLPGPVAFFDGECNVCDWSVRFLLAHDRRGELRYASLQGETAAALIAERADFPSGVDTVVVAEPLASGEVRLHTESDGVIRALQLVGGAPWRARLLRVVPRPLRDLGYRLFARNRYRLFGRKDVCALPTPVQRALLLP
jgi:predicted DCC family thiol-disulfide oxidoreductase YuxK